jgi:MPBQ/MSBQ methyltransferase
MSSQLRLVRSYNRTIASDLLRRYYEDSGFLNWGYWDTESKSQREASEALVDKLLDKIPDKGGRILDVACGLGASTRRLMRTYPPHMITGVNFSEVQIAEARKRSKAGRIACIIGRSFPELGGIRARSDPPCQSCGIYCRVHRAPCSCGF